VVTGGVACHVSSGVAPWSVVGELEGKGKREEKDRCEPP